MKKKNSRLWMIAAIIAVVCAGVVVLISNSKTADNSNSSNSVAENNADRTSSGSQVIDQGGSLVIAADNITTKASFYPVEVDGVQMEVLALKDSKGKIRTAFNTCQVCYSSGNGYYVQTGNYLVCQNCGNRFASSQVEVESGGCNPWPIFAENKTETDDSIEISYDFLKKSTRIFKSWKNQYS